MPIAPPEDRITRFDNKDDWLAFKRQTISATDVAAICGLLSYRSPLAVYTEKVLAPEDNPNAAMARGVRLEKSLLEAYADERGVELFDPGARWWCVTHPEIPWLTCSPDGAVAPWEKAVECKSAGYQTKDEWGEPGTDEIPGGYLAQCAIQMACMELDECDVPAAVGTLDSFDIWRVERAHNLEQTLIAKASEFRERHILSRVPPEFDGSEGGNALLRAMYPANERPVLIQAPPGGEYELLLSNLMQARAEFDEAKGEKEALAQRIKALIGDAAGIESVDVVATWKRNRDSSKVDYEAALADVVRATGINEAELRPIIEANTKTRPGARVFRPKFKK